MYRTGHVPGKRIPVGIQKDTAVMHSTAPQQITNKRQSLDIDPILNYFD